MGHGVALDDEGERANARPGPDYRRNLALVSSGNYWRPPHRFAAEAAGRTLPAGASGDVGASDIRALDIRALDIRALDVGASDIGASGIRALYIRALDTRALEIRACTGEPN
jgi:hypothetical protein